MSTSYLTHICLRFSTDKMAALQGALLGAFFRLVPSSHRHRQLQNGEQHQEHHDPQRRSHRAVQNPAQIGRRREKRRISFMGPR
ncbi:hypothetical protein BGP84_18745 [Pseudomonas putida]|uniref:Uncharacterized protein n=1 Tax=Pseudomonas putida TaxID=303 RepID=A0A2S3WU30_PSEPU|nr:hypothetical protein BGP84_18745 [Pseudomonas putida]POG07670.1 hypothetical protein BGP85_12785 [Pseudomonas putida]